MHVRDYTKGHPSLVANNHPIRHGAVVGIHNGIIANDEQILARHGFERAEPGMTVDSEAIFVSCRRVPEPALEPEELHGSMAAAWFDERDDETPLPGAAASAARSGLGEAAASSSRRRARRSTSWSATRASACGSRSCGEGTPLAVTDGAVRRTDSFEPDRSFVEGSSFPRPRARGGPVLAGLPSPRSRRQAPRRASWPR